MTDVVVTVKLAMVLPAATVTEPGTTAAALLLESETDTPPVGAEPLSVTVPVVEVPPVTLDGLIATDDSATVAEGVMVSPVVLLAPL